MHLNSYLGKLILGSQSGGERIFRGFAAARVAGQGVPAQLDLHPSGQKFETGTLVQDLGAGEASDPVHQRRRHRRAVFTKLSPSL